MDAATRQTIETVSQLMLKANNLDRARLLSLVDDMETGEKIHGGRMSLFPLSCGSGRPS